MTIETTSARTRRAILAGGVGAVAAVAVNALARPEHALAVDPNDVVLGGTNAATTPTVINNFTNGETVFAAQSNSAGPGAACVLSTSAGAVAVRGQATTGNGVEGSSDSGLGMVGSSNAGPGRQGPKHQRAGSERHQLWPGGGGRSWTFRRQLDRRPRLQQRRHRAARRKGQDRGLWRGDPGRNQPRGVGL